MMDADSQKVRELESEQLEKTFVHDVYDKMAPHFSDRRLRAWPLVKEFLLSLEVGSLVADVGCGNGKYLGINTDIYKLGCDMCLPLVNNASHNQHEVMVCDNLCLPYRAGSFDAVISIGVIHHFSTQERRIRAIRELARLLTRGGRALIYVWALEQKRRKFEGQDVLIPWQAHHLRRDRKRERHGSHSKERCSSTSSISEDDFSSVDSDFPPIQCPCYLVNQSNTNTPPEHSRPRERSSVATRKLRSLLTEDRYYLDSEGCSHHSSTSDIDEWGNDYESRGVSNLNCLGVEYENTSRETDDSRHNVRPKSGRDGTNVNTTTLKSHNPSRNQLNSSDILARNRRDVVMDKKESVVWTDCQSFHCSVGDSPTAPHTRSGDNGCRQQELCPNHSNSDNTPSPLRCSGSGVHFCCYGHHKGHDLRLKLKSSHNVDCDNAVKNNTSGDSAQSQNKESFTHKVASTFRKIFGIKSTTPDIVQSQKLSAIERETDQKLDNPPPLSGDVDKDVAYKDLINFIVANETDLFMNIPIQTDKGVELFAVREFPQSSRAKEESPIEVVSNQPQSQSQDKHSCYNGTSNHSSYEPRRSSGQNSKQADRQKRWLKTTSKKSNDLAYESRDLELLKGETSPQHFYKTHSRKDDSKHSVMDMKLNGAKTSVKRRSRHRRRSRTDSSANKYSDDDEDEVFTHNDYSTTQELLNAQESILSACSAVSAYQQAAKTYPKQSSNNKFCAEHFGSTDRVSLGSNSSDTFTEHDKLNEKDCKRYYHVFREGELTNLIERFVPELRIIESRYDHANWSLIAQKI